MIAQIADVVDRTFDFIIAGGGTAGLTLAARLTEDPSISVLVLEAGEANLDDPKITIPAQFAHTFGNPKYDWSFATTEQEHSQNRVFHWARGKGLGGSSALNFYAWIKPPAGDVDAIEKLGNPGWNWKEYLKYTRISETYHSPGKEHMDVYPHTHERDFRGTSGPIQTTIPHHIHEVDLLFQETMRKKGLAYINDPYGGNITGTFMASSNLDPRTWTRSYAVTGYYLPNQGRANLVVVTEATVSRVLFADSQTGEDLTATGVEFVYEEKKHKVHAKKEVILSAGAIKSSQILELSGIGRRDVLSQIGVDIKVELPGVGENVQDHLYMGVSFELQPHAANETFDLMREPEYAAKAMALHAERKGMHRLGFTSFAYFPLSAANPKDTPALIEKAVKSVEEHLAKGESSPGLAEQLDIQIKTLRDETAPDMEIIAFPGFFTSSTPEPGKKYVSVLIVLNHPLSRGTIHAVSDNPLQQPAIDPHYFEHDFDLENIVQHIKFIKSMADTEPWKSAIVKEVDPGSACNTDEEIREYIQKVYGTCWHTIGSTSMLPREKHGVVDPNLKVYGTTNLRVVDIGIIPIQIAAHTHATAYVIAEKAADIIRGLNRS